MHPRIRWASGLTIFTTALAVLMAPDCTLTASGADPKVEGTLPKGAVLRLGSTAFRHGGGVRGLVVLPGGKEIVTAGTDGISAWEVGTGQRTGYAAYPAANKRVKLPAPAEPPAVQTSHGPLVVTPDSKSLLWRTPDQVYRYLLPLAAPEDRMLRAADNPPTRITACPPAEKVFGVDSKRKLVAWRPGEKDWTDVGLPAFASSSLALVGGGGVIAVAAVGPRGDPNGRIRLWDAVKGKELDPIEVGRPVHALAISADGKWLITAALGGGKEVQVWSVEGGKETASWRCPSPHPLAISADGGLAACREGLSTKVEVFDAKTGKSLSVPMTGTAEMHFLEFLPDGSGLVGVGTGGMIHVWDPRTGKSLVPPSPGHTAGVRALATPNREWITAGDDGAIILWDAAGKEVRRFEGHEAAVGGMALSADGKTLFTAGTLHDKTVRAWDVNKGGELRKYTNDQGGGQQGLALSPNGEQLAVCLGRAGKGGILLLDAATLKPKENLKGNTGPGIGSERFFTFAGNDRLVVGHIGIIRAWDVAKRTELYNLPARMLGGDGATPTAVAAAPDGKTFAACLQDLTAGSVASVAVRKTETGKEVGRIGLGKGLTLTAVAYLPDGKAVVVGDAAGKVWVIGLEKQAVRRTFEGHRGPVLCLAVAPDGKTVASGGADTTVLVWDLAEPAKKP